MYEGGMGYMRYSISDTAEWGDYTMGPKIIGEETRYAMYEALKDIQSGKFAKDWLLENRVGRPQFNALRRQNREHLIEEVGADLRAMMPWLKESK
jgi:ketol-acid reductoisomerase